jgi:hypothetical protein
MHFYKCAFLLAIATSLPYVVAYFRMSCPGRLVRERLGALPPNPSYFADFLDPVVNNGTTAAHVHNVVGGSAFGPSMTYNQTQQAKCSSCTIKEDKSN